MGGRDQESSLALVTLATLVMGLDYALGLFFPDWGAVASLNRILFLGIIVYDYSIHPSRYSNGGSIYVACFFILIACIPFLLYVEADITGPQDAFTEFTALIGTFAYMLFFYANCRNARVASRICVVLFLSSLLMMAYLLGIVLGITGEAEIAWRGDVRYTRASGEFDPNIVMLYLISCFAFGPLLALHSRAFEGFWRGVAVIALVCLGLYVTLQLNSRSGTVVLAATLIVSLMFRSLLARNRNLSSRIYAMCFVALFVSIPVILQLKFGVFDTIVSIYGETYLATDTSFVVRMISYEYLIDELLTGLRPSCFVGSVDGYLPLWNILGGHNHPHCSLVDFYIKGGVVYLFIYCCLLASSILSCMRCALWDKDLANRAICAGFFAYLIGFGPMMMTLSVENHKMSYGIMGCALGFTAHIRRNALAKKRRAMTTELGDIARCPG